MNNPFEFHLGDRVKVNEGKFENFQGDVREIDYASGRITVNMNIFGRNTPIEVEPGQLERINKQ